ncbi:MAG: ribbon-helix-helix domain-containing protein [Solirubrobacteraceae bacterium]|nr:ribbon-helix-helix domain-containing protein [Solirubrobacteraceae bacterium]
MCKKRSVEIAGRRSSISLEDSFWNEANKIAEREGITVSNLVARESDKHRSYTLSACIRLLVLDDLLARLEKSERSLG